jgi:ABC-type uncharacterized transport system ATPase subunit
MDSVELLCDKIALINRSEKVLEGNVEDIKNQFKSNTYEVIYDGDIVHKEYCDVEKLNLVCLVEDIEIEIPIYWFK